MTPDRILVVEDEAIVAMDISHRLKRMGYEVIGTAASGEIALQLVEQHAPDLVLMDIRLAGQLDGIETAALLRQSHDVPIIYLTAHTDSTTLERAKATEPYGYIVKPIETSQLTTTITMALYKHQMELKVKASQSKFSRLAEVNPSMIVIAKQADIDREFDILYVNPAYYVITGRTNTPTRISPAVFENIITPQQYALLASGLDEVAKGAKESVQLELPYELVTGQMHWLAIALVQIEFEGQDAVLLTGTDTTRQREAEQARFELEMEQERRRLLQSLVDDFLHDFKTPISVIRTANYMLGHAEHQSEVKRYRRLIDTQTVQLENMIDDITQMSNLESDDRLDLSLVSVNHLIEQVISSQWVAAQEKQQALTMQCESCELAVVGDSNYLLRAFSNIVSNSVRYTPEQGNVEVRVYSQQGQVLIDVVDTGIGIPREDVPLIFDRFYRAGNAREFSKNGTGLGLAITKKIIELHDGKMDVRSQPGHGTTFQIALPIANCCS